VIDVPLPIDAIRRCASNPEFLAAMKALYVDLDREIAANHPVCTNRGACCKFAAFDHRLYVTTAELAYFLGMSKDPLLAPPDRSFCPYQQVGQCTARSARPAGCRIFYCDPKAQSWQSPQTELTLGRLREVSERFDLPYAYVEWTSALRRLGGRIVSDQPTLNMPIQIDTPSKAP
jgi:hypothetical protein